MKKEELFDTSLLKDFRNTINSSNVFCDVPEYRHLWNLVCATMDRLDSAVYYLNHHLEQPKTEEDFIFFLVYASMLKDGIYKFYENIYKSKPKTISYKKWFKGAHNYSRQIFDEMNCPTDDVFFEYIRALAFAHPFEVSKRNGRSFMNNGEIHCSPWVFSHCLIGGEKDSVGLRVYSSDEEGLEDVFVSFENLKRYLLERYSLIKTFIKWGRDEIIKQNTKWMETKVDRTGDAISTLNNVCKILEERFERHYTIDEAIKILESSFKDERNIAAVECVKNRIMQALDPICDCVDILDYEGMEEHLDFLYERPKNLHQHAHYELEKTFDYLDDERGMCLPGSNEEWGLIQAAEFYKAYAHKYVFIDFKEMSNLEIKILIRTSLILGKEKEKRG